MPIANPCPTVYSAGWCHWGQVQMSASNGSARRRPYRVRYRVKRDHRSLRLSIAFLALVNGAMQTARATDLTSSQTGYVLSPGDNPFTVVTDARIDTRTNGGIALYGSASQAVTWTLTNHGSIAGAYFAIEFDSFASILNNGPVSSASTTALALYGGGKIVNATGASIVGPRDAVYANAADSVVINAGEMGGSAVDNSSSQAGIHLPSGGTITNLPTGRITGLGSAILADSATTLLNEGAITSLNGVAIDLSASMTGTRTGSVVSNSGSITGRGGTAILFGPNDDTLLITGTSIIVGIVEAGGHSVTGTNTLILGGGDAGSFDISGVGATATVSRLRHLAQKRFGHLDTDRRQ